MWIQPNDLNLFIVISQNRVFRFNFKHLGINGSGKKWYKRNIPVVHSGVGGFAGWYMTNMNLLYDVIKWIYFKKERYFPSQGWRIWDFWYHGRAKMDNLEIN